MSQGAPGEAEEFIPSFVYHKILNYAESASKVCHGFGAVAVRQATIGERAFGIFRNGSAAFMAIDSPASGRISFSR